jgi:xanthine dehydrogenase accessory factor
MARRPVALLAPEHAGIEKRPLALIKGAGDLASGVALCLTRAGYSVVMTETARPTVVRRTVAFAEAVYEGRVRVEGVEGALATDGESVAGLVARGILPVIVDPEAHIRHQLDPDLLVDAIMAKRNLGTRITDAPAVVALGPGFIAGRDAHAVIETMRGGTLGQVITRGEALPSTGIPAERNGFGKERLLRSPCEGVFVPLSQIGDQVQKGQVVGLVDKSPVVSQLDGIIRGILREGLRVTTGFKLGDVDPGATRRDCYLVSDKALAIGSGVLRAACSLLSCAISAG